VPPSKLVVVNLRAQPVEIQHGGEVVVVPEFAHAELPELAGGGGQLAELERQGAVAVHAAPAPKPPAPKPPAVAKKPPAKKPTPPKKKPQGGA
jgi:hypothetical protein